MIPTEWTYRAHCQDDDGHNLKKVEFVWPSHSPDLIALNFFL